MAEKVEKVVEETPKAEEFVKIRIPRTPGKIDEPDVVVWVNDRRFIIQRGVTVSVPECVAEILKNRDDMLEYIYNYENSRPNRE